MPKLDFLKATLPLFQNELIEVIEWSFDTIQFQKNEPKWLSNLISEYSKNDRLIGHGVYFSVFDATWDKRQIDWLKKLKKEVKRYNYRHISEHFGFMSSPDYHSGCPLPVPLNNLTLNIGIDRLKRLQEVAEKPIGIENLAFSFSIKDVQLQGEFIEKLIKPINGFIILDLHNIYCQSANFNIDMMALINLYPLDLVKEIHISGGSWQEKDSQGNPTKIRRDTHDDVVPKAIFDILPTVLEKCINTEFIILERLGNTFKNQTDILNYSNDFMELRKIIDQSSEKIRTKKWGNSIKADINPINDHLFKKEQILLAETLLTVKSHEELTQKIQLKNWDLKSWEPKMTDTAVQLLKKWNQ